MEIKVICIGKLKEKYWQDAVSEYQKRIGRFCNISIEELKETKLPANASAADEAEVMRDEGERILQKASSCDLIIALTPEGKSIDSPELSRMISDSFSEGKRTIGFLIGGSLGLSDEVKVRADEMLSMSKMTFPHQLARVMIVEQIYRAFKISRGETYHK